MKIRVTPGQVPTINYFLVTPARGNPYIVGTLLSNPDVRDIPFGSEEVAAIARCDVHGNVEQSEIEADGGPCSVCKAPLPLAKAEGEKVTCEHCGSKGEQAWTKEQHDRATGMFLG